MRAFMSAPTSIRKRRLDRGDAWPYARVVAVQESGVRFADGSDDQPIADNRNCDTRNSQHATGHPRQIAESLATRPRRHDFHHALLGLTWGSARARSVRQSRRSPARSPTHDCRPSLTIQFRGTSQRTGGECFRSAVQPQQRDGVARGGLTRDQPMVEDQPVGRTASPK